MNVPSPASPLSSLRYLRLKIGELPTVFASKVRRRGYKDIGGVEQDDEILQPLLPKYPEGWGEATDTPDANRAASSNGRQFKAGERSTARKELKRKIKRVVNSAGRTMGNAVIPARKRANANLQLAYPPFMLSAGVFMYSL